MDVEVSLSEESWQSEVCFWYLEPSAGEGKTVHLLGLLHDFAGSRGADGSVANNLVDLCTRGFVDHAGSGGCEGFDCDYVVFAKDAGAEQAGVGDGEAVVEVVTRNCVAGEVDDGFEAVRGDCSFDCGADFAYDDFGFYDVYCGFECGFCCFAEFVMVAEVHGYGGVGDVSVDVGSDVQFDQVAFCEGAFVAGGGGVVGCDVVEGDIGGE